MSVFDARFFSNGVAEFRVECQAGHSRRERDGEVIIKLNTIHSTYLYKLIVVWGCSVEVTISGEVWKACIRTDDRPLGTS